ncbi:MAG: peroxide stress protein YaaA, partial [Gammaproteobacteria bacterium]|nr:peroxide stress protein YaaA [Gammaproteobacteria bacterium]
MLIVISPAKTLDLESKYKKVSNTKPEFLTDSRKLVNIMRQHTSDDLKKLMHTSEAISTLNVERFKKWKTPFSESNARPSIFTFKGDVYTGLEVESFSAADLKYSQDHLRILSGLYGLLKPLDLMQAYRLEMGTGLENDRGKNLYAFWGDKITRAVNRDLKAQDDGVLINLASNEYFSVLDKKLLEADIVTPVFKDYSKGKFKVISFF